MIIQAKSYFLWTVHKRLACGTTRMGLTAPHPTVTYGPIQPVKLPVTSSVGGYSLWTPATYPCRLQRSRFPLPVVSSTAARQLLSMRPSGEQITSSRDSEDLVSDLVRCCPCVVPQNQICNWFVSACFWKKLLILKRILCDIYIYIYIYIK